MQEPEGTVDCKPAQAQEEAAQLYSSTGRPLRRAQLQKPLIDAEADDLEEDLPACIASPEDACALLAIVTACMALGRLPAMEVTESRNDRTAAARKALKDRGANTTSKLRGVTHHTRTDRWEAHIWDQGKQLYLGGYSSEFQAGLSHDLAVMKLRGLTNPLNFQLPEPERTTYINIIERVSNYDVIHVLRQVSRSGPIRTPRTASKARARPNHKPSDGSALLAAAVTARTAAAAPAQAAVAGALAADDVAGALAAAQTAVSKALAAAAAGRSDRTVTTQMDESSDTVERHAAADVGDSSRKRRMPTPTRVQPDATAKPIEEDKRPRTRSKTGSIPPPKPRDSPASSGSRVTLESTLGRRAAPSRIRAATLPGRTPTSRLQPARANRSNTRVRHQAGHALRVPSPEFLLEASRQQQGLHQLEVPVPSRRAFLLDHSHAVAQAQPLIPGTWQGLASLHVSQQQLYGKSWGLPLVDGEPMDEDDLFNLMLQDSSRAVGPNLLCGPGVWRPGSWHTEQVNEDAMMEPRQQVDFTVYADEASRWLPSGGLRQRHRLDAHVQPAEQQAEPSQRLITVPPPADYVGSRLGRTSPGITAHRPVGLSLPSISYRSGTDAPSTGAAFGPFLLPHRSAIRGPRAWTQPAPTRPPSAAPYDRSALFDLHRATSVDGLVPASAADVSMVPPRSASAPVCHTGMANLAAGMDVPLRPEPQHAQHEAQPGSALMQAPQQQRQSRQAAPSMLNHTEVSRFAAPALVAPERSDDAGLVERHRLHNGPADSVWEMPAASATMSLQQLQDLLGEALVQDTCSTQNNWL